MMRKSLKMFAIIISGVIAGCSGPPTEPEEYQMFTTANQYELGARVEIILKNGTSNGIPASWCDLELQTAKDVITWIPVPALGGCRDLALYIPPRSEVKTSMTLWDAVDDGFYRIVDTVRNVRTNTFSVGGPRGQ